MSSQKHEAHAKLSKARSLYAKAAAFVKREECNMVWQLKLVQASAQQLQSSSQVYVKPGL